MGADAAESQIAIQREIRNDISVSIFHKVLPNAYLRSRNVLILRFKARYYLGQKFIGKITIISLIQSFIQK